jgi:hypothetical protein
MPQLTVTSASSGRRALLSLVDEDGARAGKYTVDVRGVQICDHGRQDNVFNAPAGASKARPGGRVAVLRPGNEGGYDPGGGHDRPCARLPAGAR